MSRISSSTSRSSSFFLCWLRVVTLEAREDDGAVADGFVASETGSDMFHFMRGSSYESRLFKNPYVYVGAGDSLYGTGDVSTSA
jgi:hypothetical protein